MTITKHDNSLTPEKEDEKPKKTFIRKESRKFEDATKYKLLYFEDGDVDSRIFNSSQSLSQYDDRRADDLSYIEIGRLALINDIWEPYAVIGKKSITMHDLNIICERLDECLKYSKL